MRNAGERAGLTPEAVRIAYLEAGGHERRAADALGVSQSTVRHHLKRAGTLSVPKVNLPDLDPEDPTARAVAVYVRTCLERVGITR